MLLWTWLQDNELSLKPFCLSSQLSGLSVKRRKKIVKLKKLHVEISERDMKMKEAMVVLEREFAHENS